MRVTSPYLLTLACCALACGGRYERDSQQDSSVAGQPARPPTGGGGGKLNDGNAGKGGSAPLDECQEQARAYTAYRQQVIDEFSSEECATDEECLSIYFPTSCDSECFRLTTAARRPVVDRLNSYVTANCSGACAAEIAPCGMPPAPRCVAGRCL